MANSETITINVKAIADMSDVLSNTKQIQNALNQLKLPANLTTQFNQNFSNIEREAAKVQAILNKPVKTKADLSGLETSFKKINTDLIQLQNGINKINPDILKESFQIDTSKLTAAREEVEKLEQTLSQNIDASGLQEVLDAYKQLTEQGHKSKFAEEFAKAFKAGDINAAEQALAKLNNQLKQFEGKAVATGSEKWAANVKDYSDLISVFTDQLKSLKENSDISPLIQQLGQAREKLANLSEGQWQAFLQTFQYQGPVNAIQQLINSTSQYENELRDTTTAQVQLNSELSQVKNRITYFLGLSNAVNLFKRAVRGAFNTVKELDAAMTETAVVTDFTVGDMWAQLPRYTKAANELGVTTKGAYETMTLFYQQGLNTDQAFALGTETMKMARIAGLDYADATDAMTAALRGFNMELNETSAQRVNDVYSQLAAKTASNVEEISTAMTKTASIAHNAGMEFETTSAYLSQIIETTREAPETAGTALKTVIARFTELKKPLEEIGEVEGEVVDANKIETALKSVGVALRDAQGQFRDLDDVFLDLNKKWDSLSTNQQRYIATMAAGSRQQSRFIAMMSDYSRTQELIGEAYDSAGASQQQYEKTLDSLESKLNKLKNAWNEFLMGLTNSIVIKGAVDALTWLINGVNKLTSVFGESVGSILKWVSVVATIGGLKRFFNSNFFGNLIGKVGNSALGRFFGLNNNILTKKEANTASGKIVSSAETFKRIIISAAQEAAKIEVAGERAGAAVEVNGEQAGTMAGHAAQTSLLSWLGGGAVGGAHAASGVALSGIGALGIAAIVAAVLAVVGTAIYKSTPVGQINSQVKNAEKISVSLAEAAASAKEISSSLNSVLKGYSDYNEAVKNAFTLEEKQQAISDRNDYILNAIAENQDLQALTQAEFGSQNELILSFNEAELQELINRSERGVDLLSANSYFAEAYLSSLQQQKDQLKYDRGLYGDEAVYLSEGERLREQELRNSIDQAGRDAINSAKLGYAQLLTSSGADITNEAASGLTSLLAKSFNPDEYNNRVLEKLGSLQDEALDKNVQAATYRQYYGVSPSENMDSTEVLRRIAEAQVGEEDNKVFDKVENLLKSSQGEQYNELLSLFNGQGKAFSRNLALLGENATLEDILGISNLTDILDELAEATQSDATVLKEQLQAQYEIRREQQRLALIDIGTNLRSRGYSDQLFEDFASLKDFDAQEYIYNILSQIENANFGEQVGNTLIKGISSANWEGSSLQNWFNSIDFSNPIEAIGALKAGAESADKTIKVVASDLETSALKNNAFSNEAQVQYLLTSQTFNDLNDEIEEFIDENGKISASNIKELTGSCKNLDQILKNGTVSANGLANILNSMSKGSLGIQDIDNSIINAANSMGVLEAQTTEVLDRLSNFDPGPNEKEFANFLGEAYEVTNEAVENWYYGSDQARNYIKEVFGQDAFADINNKIGSDYEEAYVARLKFYNDILAQNKENTSALWSSAVAADESGIFSFQEGGKLFIDTVGKTYDDIKDALVGLDLGGFTLSDTLAEIMLGDFGFISPGWEHEIAQNEAQKGLTGWIDGLGKTAEGARYYTEEQLETYKEFLRANDVSEDTINSIMQSLQDWENLGVVEKLEKSWDFTNADETIKNLQELGYETEKYFEGTKKFVSQSGQVLEGPSINIDQIRSDLAQAGITSQTAVNDFINSMYENLGDSATGFWTEIGGQTQWVAVKEGQTAAEAYAKAIEDYDSSEATRAMAEIFADVFTGKISDVEEELPNIKQSTSETAIAAGQWGDNQEKVADAMERTADAAERAKAATSQDPSEITTQTTHEVTNTIRNEETEVYNVEFSSTGADETKAQIAEVKAEAEEPTLVSLDESEGISSLESVEDENRILGTELAAKKPISVDNSLAFTNIRATRNAWETWTPTVKYAKVITVKQGTVAKGGVVSSYASGTNKVKPGRALTGEEGPEIVWNKEKGYAYITGSKHPEFQNLVPGDRIFNAQETKKILGSAANGGKVESYASGAWKTTTTTSSSSSSSRSSSSSGSSSSVSSEEFESFRNDLDWLFNLVEDIAELEHKQTRYQEDYEYLLKDSTKSIKQTYEAAVKYLGSLEATRRANEALVSLREQEMKDFMDYTNLYSEYLQFNWEDRTLEIDWDRIERITDVEFSKTIQEMVSQAQDIQGKMDDAEDALRASTKAQSDFMTSLREPQIEMEQRIEKVLINMRQEVIDNLGVLNDTLSQTNNDILNAIQSEISLQRQIRDNTKTEQEIADLEARIAFLARDTSGGNQEEIMELQKTLADKRESYEDVLVDQSIDKLQESNEKAAEQRERQIELMQSQLDFDKENGAFNEEIKGIIEDALKEGSDDGFVTPTKLQKILAEDDNFKALTDAQKEAWVDDFMESIKAVQIYTQAENGQLDRDVTSEAQKQSSTSLGNTGKSINEISGMIGTHSQSYDTLGYDVENYSLKVEELQKNLKALGYFDYAPDGLYGSGTAASVKKFAEDNNLQVVDEGRTATSELISAVYEAAGKKRQDNGIVIDPNLPIYQYNRNLERSDSEADDVRALQTALTYLGYDLGGYEPDGIFGSYTLAAAKAFQRDMGINSGSDNVLGYGENQTLDLLNQAVLMKSRGGIWWKRNLGEGATGPAVKDFKNILQSLGYLSSDNNQTNEYKNATTQAVKALQAEPESGISAPDGIAGPLTYEALYRRFNIPKYKKGGLADFTGPAWLDGTKTKPEGILNAVETEAFLKLAEVLPSLMKSDGGTSNNYGDITLNLVMNVEEIGSDYDVDRIADRVKEIIYNSSSYRNVNTLNFIR